MTTEKFQTEFFEKLTPTQKLQLLQIAQGIKEEFIAKGGKIDLRDRLSEIKEPRKRRVEQLYRETLDEVKKVFLRGRKIEDLAEAERRLLNKIDKVRLKTLDSEKMPRNMCPPTPNAHYIPNIHGVALCPESYYLPDATIVSIVAHEVCHSVDPCNSQAGVSRFNKTNYGKFGAQNLANSELLGIFRSLAIGLREGQLVGLSLDKWLGENAAKLLREGGVFTTEVDGVPFSQYPLKGVYDCLVTKGFRPETEDQRNALVEETIALRQELFGEQYDPGEDRAALLQALSRYPECLGNNRLNSQMGESIADWCGGEVLASYLKRHPPKTNLDRLAAVSFFAAEVCSKRAGPRDRNSYGAIVEGIDKDLILSRDSHPVSTRRIEKILLANPEVRSALKCEPQPEGSSCEYTPMTGPSEGQSGHGGLSGEGDSSAQRAGGVN